MTAMTASPWCDQNQRALVEALERLRAALERRVSGSEPLELAELSIPEDCALARIRSAFDLSPFETRLLLLCAGPELEANLGQAIARAQGDPRRVNPTFSLALALWPDAHWSALAPHAPLRRWRLIELGAGETLVQRPLYIDERVLHYLAGVSGLDERISAIFRPVPAPASLPPSHQALAESIHRRWMERDPANRAPLTVLCGDSPADQRAVAAAACAAAGLTLAVVRAADLPAAAAERESLARLWEREAVLAGSALLVDAQDLEGAGAARVTGFLETVRGFAFLSSREPMAGLDLELITFEVEKPASDEQLLLWKRALGPAARGRNGSLEIIARHFNFSVAEISRIAGQAAIRRRSTREQQSPSSRPALRPGEPVRGKKPAPRLWDLCRAAARAPP